MTTQSPFTPQEEERRRQTQEELDRINAEYAQRAEAERQSKAAAEQAAQEALDKDRAERMEAEMKSAARRLWDGTADEFESQWPTLRVELLRDRVKKQTDTARDNFGKMVQGFF